MSQLQIATIERLAANKIAVTFPPGVTARVLNKVPVDELLKVLSAEPEAGDAAGKFPVNEPEMI